MIDSEYLPRLADQELKDRLELFGGVCVEGPKWCGKTWTASRQANSSVFLDDPAGGFQFRHMAKMNPALVLDGETPRLIDEWQEAPGIWDAVRHRIDQTRQKGQFILTGSATPNRTEIVHSGAGRLSRLRMRPMSLFESGDSSGRASLAEICQGSIQPFLGDEPRLENIIYYIVRGGWPGNLGVSTEKAGLLADEYINAVVGHDIYHLDEVLRNPERIALLLRSLARNESTFASNNTLIRDMARAENDQIDSATLSTYLNVLRRLFLIDDIPPFSTNARSTVRIRKADKRHFVDPSLPRSLLRVSSKHLLRDLETLGFLFESLCLRDLIIYAESFGGRVFHYNDYKNKEIDAVVELPGGEWSGFEIKLGANQIEAAAKNLLAIGRSFENDPKAVAPTSLCVICGLSAGAYQRDDGVFVVPITALRD